MTRPETVTTTLGNRYRLGQMIGRGGQGAVFAVEGERLAVKLCADHSAPAREKLRDRLAAVGRHPIQELAIARPLEQLRPPHVGYVMELLTGMVPLRELGRPPKDVSATGWYLDTGGLRRRLRVFARIAEIFAQVHGKGLVFVDPSPNNVFISSGTEGDEVRLIDPDNLRASTTPGTSLYTPGYGAPEIVRGTGRATSLTDSHAFAVMAFESLSLAHPLLGDFVVDGEPDIEDRALAGQIPWIDHPEDETNRSSTGIPREIVLSEILRRDFQATFGPGLLQPEDRPRMATWAEHLHRAADRTIRCPQCKGTFYFDQPLCPWCDTPRPTFVMVAAMLWDPERLAPREGTVQKTPGFLPKADRKPRIMDAMVLAENEPTVLPDRFTNGGETQRPRLRATFTQGRIVLESLDGNSWRLVTSDGRKEAELRSRPAEIPLEGGTTGWWVHSGPDNRIHRVLRFEVPQGGTR